MSSRLMPTAALSLAVLVVAAVPAAAQIQTGSILVKAVDEQRGVLPGVSVTISSTTLPSAITGATDAGGVYQVPGLAPGTYTVKTALAGFASVVHEGVVVRQGQTANVE